MIKINKKEKDELRNNLYKRDGEKCYYCEIKEEDFIPIWGKFYGGKTRGKKLEVDRRDNEKDYTLENCVLACPICNNAKSDKFTDEEFKKVGKSIKQIWLLKDKMGCGNK
jgi:5-methylcytosine-specific restriction endonuclease McrA